MVIGRQGFFLYRCLLSFGKSAVKEKEKTSSSPLKCAIPTVGKCQFASENSHFRLGVAHFRGNPGSYTRLFTLARWLKIKNMHIFRPVSEAFILLACFLPVLNTL